MSNMLRIGEYASLGTSPYFFPLKHVFNEPNWTFIPGTPEELGNMLERGELDVALVSPLTLVNSPLDYLVFKDLGYGAARHVREMLLFSDMLLDDMDELTVSLPEGGLTSSAIVKVVLGKHLQYSNEFIDGWGSAESYVLEGDPALRERMLSRYAYRYDVGDLWRHYTRKPMIYYLWAVRRESMREKGGMIILFHRLLRQAVEVASSDWSRLALLQEGYGWLNRGVINQLWPQIDYLLHPGHFDGLSLFYDDLAELDLIDDTPELVFFEES